MERLFSLDYFQNIPMDPEFVIWSIVKDRKHQVNSQLMKDLENIKKNELHFTCGELPEAENLNQKGSRYFHAIFDKKTGKINHCDGAIRYYNDEEFDFRKKYHVRNSEVRKCGTRIKIFQIDELIQQKLFMDLLVIFFVWNDDIRLYFN